MGYEMKRKKGTFVEVYAEKTKRRFSIPIWKETSWSWTFKLQRRWLQQPSADKEMKHVGVDKINYYGSEATAPPQHHIVMRHMRY